MPIRKSTLGTFLLITAMCSTACHAKEISNSKAVSLPSTFFGTWQVTAVLTDQGKSRWNLTREDKFNIYKFMGRVISFTPKHVSINTPHDEKCEDPKLSSQQSSVEKIVALSISTRFPDPTPPTPKDMRFPLEGNTPVEVLYLNCKDGPRARNPGMQPSADRSNLVWLIILDNDQLAMSWQEETILILKRVPVNAKPVASFDCSKAATEVEKTICGSVALAAYDQSVTQTYKSALAYYQTKQNTTGQITTLKQSQKEWLTKRNNCGTDVTCLEKSMSERIGDIDYDLGDYVFHNRRN